MDTSKQVGDPDHLKVFANADAAATWFEENDPDGVDYDVRDGLCYKNVPLKFQRR